MVGIMAWLPHLLELARHNVELVQVCQRPGRRGQLSERLAAGHQHQVVRLSFIVVAAPVVHVLNEEETRAKKERQPAQVDGVLARQRGGQWPIGGIGGCVDEERTEVCSDHQSSFGLGCPKPCAGG